MSDLSGRWPLLAAACGRLGMPLAIVDLETTGGNMVFDRVTEVAVLRFDAEGVGKYGWLLNPEMLIPPFVADLTGISNEMVADAPKFAQIADQLLPLLRGTLVIAHNSRFDYTFLRREFGRAGIGFAAPALCTVQLSRRLYPEFHKHNLDSIIERCGMVVADRHRAMADVLVLADFLEKALCERGSAAFDSYSRALMNPKSLPDWLPYNLADKIYALPDQYGVLTWLDKSGGVLRRDAHTKVFSEVAQALHKTEKPMYAQCAADLAFVPAVGGLHALWLKAQLQRESDLSVRKDMREYFTVRFRPDKEGRLQAKIEALVPGRQCRKPCGLFLHKKSAKRALSVWASSFGLCPSALDVLPQNFARDGGCPVASSGGCGGGCLSEEGKALHNERVSAYAGLLPIVDWGRMHEIEIIETDILSGASMTFRCAGGALELPDGSWYFDSDLPALIKEKLKQGSPVVRALS